MFPIEKYAPLHIPQPMNKMHQDYLKLFPTLTGEDELTTEMHVATIYTFAENLNIEYLDVVMRLFV